MRNIFEQEVTNQLIDRINQLTPQTSAQWGKMDVAQMLAHNNAVYDMIFDENLPPAKGFKRWALKTFIKPMLVNEKPLKKNGRTAPELLVKSDKDFDEEKNRLVNYVKKTQELGADYFVQKENPSFGKMTEQEWSNLFHKHLDHHLTQFGV